MMKNYSFPIGPRNPSRTVLPWMAVLALGMAVLHIPEFLLLTTECHPYRGKKMTAQPDAKLRETLRAAVAAGDAFEADYVRVYDIVR